MAVQADSHFEAHYESTRNLLFAAIVLGMLVASLATTIVAAALPTIVADLGGAGHGSWVVTSYLLGAISVIPLAGKFGDLFGRKRVFTIAFILFMVASVLCALSQSMAMLLVCRVLQGLGGGVVGVSASAMAGEIAPPHRRGRYQGTMGAVFGLATVGGPLVGGLVNDQVNWRWAFWINVPISLLVLLVTAKALPESPGQLTPAIDYLGSFLVVLGAAGLTMAASWGGTTYAWGSPTIIGLFAASALALAAFVWVESHAAEPILPPRLLRSPTFALCCVLAFIVGLAMLGALTMVPIYLRYVDGVSATVSGLRMLPMAIGMLITSTCSGVLVSRTGRYKIYPVTGCAMMAIAFLLLGRMNEATPASVQSLNLFLLGAGIGMSIQLLVLIAQNTTEFDDLGVATSSVTFFRTMGSSFGTAVFSGLMANFWRGSLGPLAAGPAARAYCGSLSRVFLCAAAIALGGFGLALLLREGAPVPEAQLRQLRDLATYH